MKSTLVGGQTPNIGTLRNFAYFSLTTGKTAPRLIEDLAFYDPRHKARNGYNVLTDIPQWEDGQFKVDPAQGKGSCRHKWALDEDHSQLLDEGKLPTPQATFNVVAHCSVCRSHLAVILDFLVLGDDDNFLPCPNVDAPLHHFVHEPKNSQNLPILQPGAIPTTRYDKQVFRCSSGTCLARLSVTFRPARLTAAWIHELTNKDVLKARADQAIQTDPTRFEGHAPPSAVEVLTNLRTYIHNGMQSKEQRKILGANKKWRLCFSDSCTDLLKYLGFRRDVGNSKIRKYKEANIDSG